MSFKDYLVNLGVDVTLGAYGILAGFVGLGMVALGESAVVGAVLFVTGALSLLYTRYRKQRKGITY